MDILSASNHLHAMDFTLELLLSYLKDNCTMHTALHYSKCRTILFLDIQYGRQCIPTYRHSSPVAPTPTEV